VDPKDVEITVTGNLLTIKGERKLEKEYNNEDYFSREISYGSFERSVTLPVEVNADKIKATYKKGPSYKGSGLNRVHCYGFVQC
jgi:HSP20 family protein